MRTVVAAVCALAVPVLLHGQETPAQLEADMYSILVSDGVGVSLRSLDQRLVSNFLLLVPDLLAEDREALRVAAEEAFQVSLIQADLSGDLIANVPADALARVTDMHRSGAEAELRRAVASYEPPSSFDEFTADPGNLDRERLQLMAALVEARRQSQSELAVDEMLRQIAHEVVVALGADVAPFEPLADEVFEGAYRDRTIRLALEALYLYQPVSTDLLRATVAEYTSEDSRVFFDQYGVSLLGVVGAAGQRFAELTTEAAPEPEATTEVGLCRSVVCGLVVQWRGSEPYDLQGYGVPGDFEQYLRRGLATAGYHFARGAIDDGVTLRIWARSMPVRCETVSGTDNRTCTAVGQVQLEFIGSSELAQSPNDFQVRNSCGASDFLMASGMASLVAARLHYEFTTFEGDERSVPGC
jgi:hypothetical protein